MTKSTRTDGAKLTCTLGADPEVFVEGTASGRVLPVCGWLGGTKSRPIPLGGARSRYKVQEDGIAAEYNIPPTSSATAFSAAIGRATTLLAERIADLRPGHGLRYSPGIMMSTNELSMYPAAYRFGCSPEFDAYAEGEPVPQVTPADLVVRDLDYGEPHEWRFTGGHLHLGMSVEGKYALDIPHYVVAAMCDVLIGLPSIEFDMQGARRRFYGQAGRYRPTKYGIEYRVLSNWWTVSGNDAYMAGSWAFHTMRFLTQASAVEVRKLFNEIPWGEVRHAINYENVDRARVLYDYAVRRIDDIFNHNSSLRLMEEVA